MCLTDCNLFLFKCLRLFLINDNVTEIARPPCFLPEAFANIFVINICTVCSSYDKYELRLAKLNLLYNIGSCYVN